MGVSINASGTYTHWNKNNSGVLAGLLPFLCIDLRGQVYPEQEQAGQVACAISHGG